MTLSIAIIEKDTELDWSELTPTGAESLIGEARELLRFLELRGEE